MGTILKERHVSLRVRHFDHVGRVFRLGRRNRCHVRVRMRHLVSSPGIEPGRSPPGEAIAASAAYVWVDEAAGYVHTERRGHLTFKWV